MQVFKTAAGYRESKSGGSLVSGGLPRNEEDAVINSSSPHNCQKSEESQHYAI